MVAWGDRLADAPGPTDMCPNLLAVAAEQGQSRRAGVTLGLALIPLAAEHLTRRGPACNHSVREGTGLARCPWPHAVTSWTVRTACEFDGLDWLDVAACVNADIPLGRIRAHILSGADLDPLRLLLALSDPARPGPARS